MRTETSDGARDFVVTCIYCGTATRFPPRQVEVPEIFKCGMCGAPFVIEDPGKTAAPRADEHLYRQCAGCRGFFAKKRMVDHNYMLYCWGCFEEMEDRRIERTEHTILIVSGTVLAIIFICVMLIC